MIEHNFVKVHIYSHKFPIIRYKPLKKDISIVFIYSYKIFWSGSGSNIVSGTKHKNFKSDVPVNTPNKNWQEFISNASMEHLHVFDGLKTIKCLLQLKFNVVTKQVSKIKFF